MLRMKTDRASWFQSSLWFRILFFSLSFGCAAASFLGRFILPERFRACLGFIGFISLIILCSQYPKEIRFKRLLFGILFQGVLALLILKFKVGGYSPVYQFLLRIGEGIKKFLEFTDEGSKFLFGGLADPKTSPFGFIFAFRVLPTIIFASAFFGILNYLGILRIMVQGLAIAMRRILGTSGAETLSVSANIFLGQTEAPMLIRNYLPSMTRSELLTVMTSGFAHVSGAMLAVYIGYGADAVSIIATSVMAAPASLYLSKVMLPELNQPETLGKVDKHSKLTEHNNLIDAFAGGASSGLRLAANVAAMLIAFIAFFSMIDGLLGLLPGKWSLGKIFSFLFAPIASMLGTPAQDVPAMAKLLGYKLSVNEHFAYIHLMGKVKSVEPIVVSEQARKIAVFALTGFANFASVGIQLGGIGAMAPNRRADLAQLAMRALLVGFVVTLLNACLAVIIGV